MFGATQFGNKPFGGAFNVPPIAKIVAPIFGFLFGRTFHDTPQPTSVQGETGWFTLPRQWATKPNPLNSSQLMASPTGDFNVNPVYFCVLDDSQQTYAFQDLLLSKYLNTSGNPNYSGVQWVQNA